MARVVGQRPSEARVERLRAESLLTGATEIDLDRVESPCGEAVGVLLVVTERPDALTAAPAPAGVGVDAGQQVTAMQPAGQPPQAVRPLLGIDDQPSARVSVATRPPEVEP